jgi:hypothetical protein
MDPSNRKPFNPDSFASHTNLPFATQKSVNDATEKEPEDNRLDCELGTGPPMGKKARSLRYTNGTMPVRNGKGDKSFKHNEVHIPSVDQEAFELRVNNDALIFDVGLLRLFAHTAEREEVQAFLNALFFTPICLFVYLLINSERPRGSAPALHCSPILGF